MKFNCRYIFLLSIIFSINIITACKKEDHSRIQALWSAKDPILTPYNIRNNESNLGNILVNPSFELGKVYYEEKDIESFDVNGWKKVGSNIEWVNTQNNKYLIDEAYNGAHSIKIKRINANEIEQTGDGILSDYIKVLPGNYMLKLHLRLEDICPNQSRIGTKMYDAINIRLHYYDKNKIEIDGTEFNAFQNNNLDNTFKSFTLSNFLFIDKLGWGEIHGKTANYPFFDGDLPDKTRYVKLFIGLKASGSMWIDDVSLTYTNQNFTLYEKIKTYFDSSYSVCDLVYPKPKQLVRKSQFSVYNKELGLSPIILVPANASENLINAANALKKILVDNIKATYSEYSSGNINIVRNINLKDVPEKQLVISVGETCLYEKYQKSLPDSIIKLHKQAYYIQSLDDQVNVVFINTISNKDFTYAINTFAQLLDEKLNFHKANIIDYPDFLQRAYLIHSFDGSSLELKSKLDLFNKYKLNLPYFELYHEKGNLNYPFKSVEEFVSTAKVEEYSIMVDLLKANKESLTIPEAIDYIKTFKFSKKIPETILISGQYYQSSKSCYSDEIKYYNSLNARENLQNNHMQLLNEIYKSANNNNFIKQNIEFIAPWSRLDLIDNGLGQAEFYYYDLKNHTPENISIFWTGGSYYSSTIDFAEFYRIKKIMGKAPILIDNSLITTGSRLSNEFERNYYAGKIRTFSLFEPYNLETFDGFYNCNNKRKILLNLNSLSEFNTIRILTAANYYWNTESYNGYQSLWIVLNKLYGKENAINLINFNDAYYGLSEICQKIEIDGLQHKNIRIANLFANNLEKYFNLLEIKLKDERIFKEITILEKELLDKYNNLISAVDKN